jgi:hypothetical protein
MGHVDMALDRRQISDIEFGISGSSGVCDNAEATSTNCQQPDGELDLMRVKPFVLMRSAGQTKNVPFPNLSGNETSRMSRNCSQAFQDLII